LKGELLKVLLYGRMAEAIGPEVEVDAADGCSIAGLRERLAADHPETAETLANRRARACVGGALVMDDYVVSAEDRVEFLPPVSGG
jgi:molybdopterin converting factor small subunit